MILPYVIIGVIVAVWVSVFFENFTKNK